MTPAERKPTAGLYLAYAMIAVLILGPVVWIVGLSLRPSEGLFTATDLFPDEPTLVAYSRLLTRSQFPRQILNSVVVAFGAAMVGLIVATFGAYGCSRWDFRWKYPFMIGLLGLQLIPGATTMIPFFFVADRFNLLNTYTALILIIGAMRVPFTLWILKAFFDTIPRSLEEAALVDGASRMGALRRIVLPLSLPGLAAAVFINFLYAWNSFLIPLIINTDPSMRVALVGLSGFQATQEGQTFLNLLAAGGMLVAVPPLVLYLVLQKQFVSGLTAGGVK